MSEQQDVIGQLEAAGVLTGIRWAYRSATSRTLEIFSEPDGHDAALLGNLRFTLLRDRLDRVFACERYELPPGSRATDQLDLLYAELSQEDIRTMPHLAPDLIRRADLTGSPGWALGGRRFLLAACVFGKLDSLPWPRRARPSSVWPSSTSRTRPKRRCSKASPIRRSRVWRSWSQPSTTWIWRRSSLPTRSMP